MSHFRGGSEGEMSAEEAVRIRPWAEEDRALLEALLGDPAMTAHLGGPQTCERLDARHARYLAEPPEGGAQFAILSDSAAAAVGWVGYWRSEAGGLIVWEMGWSVLTASQGRGIATAAARLALARAAAQGSYRWVHATPDVDNAASNAVCARVGFELVGPFEGEYPPGTPRKMHDWRFDLNMLERGHAGAAEGRA